MMEQKEMNLIFSTGYSFSVPSKNKEDQRSIEETMNEIRERKRMKLGMNANDVK